ncbi:DNA helicase UvrD [Candidatus Falkowbacteria bacterium]|jgi:uncharacterized protein (TIGR00375 family)|nr:DNA helicase UvrD [Candidatus Falkowbacteria bacterium]MBT5503071.1 DNA helicase UvrD [Candidatus Falkowbacteria bacterium]MBT6573918.1 DNA helicase UvrD [Candidatus Falkowbacteria bacterium]MBT7348329.1 DNA helicase UvrD [Candidatus Falkowbacteria bacterium]MBT7500288.1 DNA helicase UvrD [Candidatus Falkowbacteria bacterium]
MRTIADLHIHSKYSRATSPQMEVVTLAVWASKKGIGVMATGDFTHPQYLKELKEKLTEDGSGLLVLRQAQNDNPVRFILSGEISCIYKDKDKTRRQHVCLLVPDFETVDKINAELNKLGCNLKSDGRPIIGLSAKRLAQICFEANEKTLVIPAHIWTPWFSLFGSKSGYDSIEECYEELTPHIYAVETGLSSDPEMNWRLSALDNLTMLSNSDAHSPKNIGREANVFDLEEVNYDEIYNIIKTKDLKKFLYTIEFYPQEGRYHFDGHSKCKFVCTPQESKNKHKNICPVCKKELVLGVEHRVDDLADRKLGFRPKNATPFKSLVPLQEIIAECYQKGKLTKTVQTVFEEMLEKKTEFEILLDLTRKEIELISSEIIAEAIIRVREGKVYTQPGYDGEYGTVKVFDETDINKQLQKNKQL